MTPALLHAVARKAEAITPDAELLARYLRAQDHAAFEELVRRHGPLVWTVCRQMLPHHADAEDAFQAVFLALVRSAASIRDGRTVPAWLHGVAVRIATRAKREFARRRARERTAALPEADRPVSDEAWGSLVAAVHEEVQKLPDAERTAFVLCELQGVSQADAAARLGWPLGSVSGRLCKARQRLLDRLTARGVAPMAVVGIGLTAGAVSAVPVSLFDVVITFPSAPVAASVAATALARGFVEGVAMRLKLTAAATVVVMAFGVTGGAIWLSKADAQNPPVIKEVKDLVDASGGGQPPGTSGGGFAPPAGGPPSSGGFPGGAPGGAPGAQPGAGGGGYPPGGSGTSGPGGMPGMMGSMMPGGMGAVHPTTWEYKFVDIKADRKEFEKTIKQHGKEGWEFCDSQGFGRLGNDLTLVFKKRKGGDLPGSWFGGMGGPGGPGPMGGGFGPPGGRAGGASGRSSHAFPLKHASASDVIATIQKVFPKVKLQTVPHPGGNSGVVVFDADPSTIETIDKLVAECEAKAAESTKPGPSIPGPMAGGPGSFGPMGPGGSAGPGTPSGPGMGPVGGPAMGTGPGPTINVYNLKHATAKEMVTVLQKLFPNVEMTADPRTNAVIVRADETTHNELKALLSRLDVDVGDPK